MQSLGEVYAMKSAVARYFYCISLSISPSVYSADYNFQDYLFLDCQSGQGAVPQCCRETDQGLGNVSGDSESSLNPTQALAAGELEWRQSVSDDDTSEAKFDLGGWAVSIQGYIGNLKRTPWEASISRSYDVDLSGLNLWASHTIASAVHPMGWSWLADYAEILDNDHMSGWQLSAGLRKEL